MTRKEKSRFFWKLFYLSLFAISMGYLESAVVIYLREIYYPGGFHFPLQPIPGKMTMIELIREAATIIMILAVAAIAARRFWERFAFFIFVFGIWDIFFYLWLKIFVNWPGSLFESDILFLIPSPWIGPVWAPVLISLLMIGAGFLIASLYQSGLNFKAPFLIWFSTLAGIFLILYSFMSDLAAGRGEGIPKSFSFYLFAAGYLICLIGFYISYRKSKIKTQ
jgi:hypothetical protein